MHKFIITLLMVASYCYTYAQDSSAYGKDSTYFIIKRLNEVTITAEKKDISSFATPVSASVVGKDEFPQDNRVDLRTLSGLAPNFYMQESGMKLSTPIYIRGIGTSSGTPPVGLYVDGVPIFDKNAFVFDLYDIRQVEILRGPQSTLYGRNSINGLINIATERPKSSFNLRAQGGYSSFNTQNYNMVMHLPIKGILHNKFAGAYNKSDGFITNLFDGSKSAGSMSYDMRYQGEVVSKKRTKLMFGVNYNKSDDGGYAYGAIDSLNVNPYDVNYNMPMHYKRDLLTSYANVRVLFDHASVSSMTSYSFSKDDQDLDADFTYLDVFNNHKESKQDLFTQEFVAQCATGKVEWTMGLFGFYKDLKNDYIARFGKDKAYLLPMPLDSARYFNKTLTYGAAAYGQMTVNDLPGGISAIVGLRYDYEQSELKYTDEIKFTAAKDYLPLHNEDEKKTFKSVLPKFSIQKKWSNRFNSYATVSKGYKAGGYNIIANDMTSTSIDLGYDAESLWNYEIGAKYLNKKQNYSLNGALFYADWRDQQIFVMGMMGPSIKNAGDARSFGAELELNWEFIPSVVYTLSTGYANAKYTHHETEAYVGNRIVMAPEFTFNSGVMWVKKLNNKCIQQATFGTNVTGFGKQYFDEANTLKQDPYFLWNANISLSGKYWGVDVWGKNILDKHFYNYMFQSPVGRKLPQYLNSGQSGIPARFGASIYLNI
ncbi:MAG: TonB-dependent receptor [Marinifilaceae bacterium]